MGLCHSAFIDQNILVEHDIILYFLHIYYIVISLTKKMGIFIQNSLSEYSIIICIFCIYTI